MLASVAQDNRVEEGSLAPPCKIGHGQPVAYYAASPRITSMGTAGAAIRARNCLWFFTLGGSHPPKFFKQKYIAQQLTRKLKIKVGDGTSNEVSRHCHGMDRSFARNRRRYLHSCVIASPLSRSTFTCKSRAISSSLQISDLLARARCKHECNCIQAPQ